MGMVDGEMLINPTRMEMTSSSLNLIVAAGPGSQVGQLDDTLIHSDVTENTLQTLTQMVVWYLYV